MSEDLIFHKSGHVATITLNRPEKLNTVTPAMGKKLWAYSKEINDDEQVRVVVLRGTGERAFSAGSDVKALDDYGTNWQLRNRADYVRSLLAIRKPVLAGIRGYCIGGGLEIALATDIRIAATSSKFGAGEIKLGWIPGAGTTQILPRVIGVGNAARWLLTGDILDAAEAHRIGLVQELVADHQLDEKIEELAHKAAANPPIAMQVMKHMIRMSQNTALDAGLAWENDMFTYCFTTKDHLEGIAAFKEKRTPDFKGE